jgi:flagellar motor switch protein FliG
MATAELEAPGTESRLEAPVLAPGETNALGVRGVRKAAIVLTALDAETSAAILRQLSEEEVHDVTREISRLTDVPKQERMTILQEFVDRCGHPEGFPNGGLEYATSVLLTAFGPETGRRMADRLVKSMGAGAVSIDSLRKTDPQHLAQVVRGEHPQTVALILCHLGTAHAAELLRALPAEVRSDVVRRMAALDQISPEVVNRIAKLVGTKLRVLGDSSLEAYRGVRAVAEVLNRVDSEMSESILETINSEDAGTAQAIRDLMFVFDDFLKVGADSVRTIVGKVERKTLTMALKGSSPTLRNHFTSLMSGRAAEMLIEDMEALGPVKIKDVQDSRQQVVAVARQLQADGAISLQAGAPEEFVV